MHFLRGIRRRKGSRAARCTRVTSNVGFMGQRHLPSSSMKNRSKPARDWTNRPCNDVSSPQNSYVSDDAFSEDACSENYDLYVSGTFDLDLAAHGSLSDSSPQQNTGFSYSKYEDEMDLVLTSSFEHNILLDAYREKVGSHFTSIDRVSSSDCSNAILVKETQSYLPVSVARGMSSLLSFSSDEDAIYEFTKTDCSLSSSSSSFEDLYEEQDKKKSDSSVCSILSSPSDWNGQDGEVQTPKGRTSTTKEDSSSILLPKVLTGTNSSSNFIKKSCNVDASNGFLQHPLHDSSISKKMPEDSRDDEEEKNGIQDEFEDEPRASPAPVFSYSPEISLIYGFPSPGVDYFDEDKKVDAVKEDIPNESQLNYHPKKISQRIRFQVKKLIREKIRHSSEQELSSYMPLLENTSASPLNFQTHELVAPLAKKLKGVNTQTAWDLTSCDVVVKEQTPSRPILIRSDHNSSSSSSSSSANAVTNVLSDSSPSLSCFTIDEKEEELQQENAALERRCTTGSSQEETRQEIIVHNDQDVPPHPSIHRKMAAGAGRMILKTTKSVSTQTSPRADTPSLSTLNLFPVGQLILDSSIGHGSDATLMKHNLIDKMMIMSRNHAGDDEKYNSRVGGVTTRTPGFSKSIYKELAACNHQEKPPRNSMPNQQSLNDDDNIKSTKEESKALKFWAMAQRRAKSGSDVHVH